MHRDSKDDHTTMNREWLLHLTKRSSIPAIYCGYHTIARTYSLYIQNYSLVNTPSWKSTTIVFSTTAAAASLKA